MQTKTIYIVGNFKMFKDQKEIQTYFDTFNNLLKATKLKPNLNFGLAINFTTLNLGLNLKTANCQIFAQNIFHLPEGAFTGETSAKMVKSTGANGVIIGHSERRTIFGETDEMINQKILLALKAKLKIILCVGETLKEYEAKQTKVVIERQIKNAFKGLNDQEKASIIIAYEPIWAIGTGKTASPQQAQEICAYIRSLINPQVVIQYGGSVKLENAASFVQEKDINGLLIGGASLDPHLFGKILKDLNQYA